jgi:hypothetical protein
LLAKQSRRADFSGHGGNTPCRAALYSQIFWISSEENKMPNEEWIKALPDGRKVKFVYQELPEDGTFITAQIAGNEVVYSVLLAKARNPLSREDVESHFKAELSKK